MRIFINAALAALVVGGITYGLDWLKTKQGIVIPAANAEPPSPSQNGNKNSPNISAGGNVNIGNIGDVINPPPAPKPDGPKDFGILKPKAELIFSPDGPLPRLEVGTSGVSFNKNDEYGALILPFLRRDQFKIELVDGHYKFSTRVTDENEKVIAEITQNDWKVAPPSGAWDRNYNDDTLEVKDSRGDLVLQVRALPDRIQFQGSWWTDSSPWSPAITQISIVAERIADITPRGAKLTIIPMVHRIPKGQHPARIEPLFRYPSDLHLGELAKR